MTHESEYDRAIAAINDAAAYVREMAPSANGAMHEISAGKASAPRASDMAIVTGVTLHADRVVCEMSDGVTRILPRPPSTR